MPELNSRTTCSKDCIFIDFRGLSSPTPLVGTMKALAALTENMHFEGLYPHNPVHLFPNLMEENWTWEVLEQTGDEVLLKIFKKAPTS